MSFPTKPDLFATGIQYFVRRKVHVKEIMTETRSIGFIESHKNVKHLCI
jgi:hypothetical protein